MSYTAYGISVAPDPVENALSGVGYDMILVTPSSSVSRVKSTYLLFSSTPVILINEFFTGKAPDAVYVLTVNVPFSVYFTLMPPEIMVFDKKDNKRRKVFAPFVVLDIDNNGKLLYNKFVISKN